MSHLSRYFAVIITNDLCTGKSVACVTKFPPHFISVIILTLQDEQNIQSVENKELNIAGVKDEEQVLPAMS